MKLTHIALVLALGLLGLTTWLAWDARTDAKGAHNQLELFQQQNGGAGNPAEQENQVLLAHMGGKKAPAADEAQGATKSAAKAANQAARAPAVASGIPEPLPAVGSGRKIDMSHTGNAALESVPPPLSPRQRMVMSVPAIGKVTEYQKQYGFVIIAAGSDQKLEKGMTFAVRRGPGIIGRIKITEVEDKSAVADLDPRTIPAGVVIETGDDVIQDLPPEA